jgi:hypothetical protein
MQQNVKFMFIREGEAHLLVIGIWPFDFPESGSKSQRQTSHFTWREILCHLSMRSLRPYNIKAPQKRFYARCRVHQIAAASIIISLCVCWYTSNVTHMHATHTTCYIALEFLRLSKRDILVTTMKINLISMLC